QTAAGSILGPAVAVSTPLHFKNQLLQISNVVTNGPANPDHGNFSSVGNGPEGAFRNCQSCCRLTRRQQQGPKVQGRVGRDINDRHAEPLLSPAGGVVALFRLFGPLALLAISDGALPTRLGWPQFGEEPFLAMATGLQIS